MPMPIVGDIISGAANIGSTLLNNSANRSLAEYQYQKNLEQWNRQNAYDSPAAQMARLKAAGLNPNLAYGNGSVSNTSAPSPQYSAPHMEAVNFPQSGIANSIKMYQDMLVNKAQANNLAAQTANTQAQTITQGLIQSQLGISNARSQFDLDLARDLRSTSLEAAKSNLQKTLVEIANIRGQTGNLSTQRKSLEQQIHESVARTQSIKSESENLRKYGTKTAPNVLGLPITKLGTTIRQGIGNLWDEAKSTYHKYFN